MQTYARIEEGAVAEITGTTEDIGVLFHPARYWVDVIGTDVQVGWQQGASGALAPAVANTQPVPAAPAPPSLNDLLAELATLRAQVAQLHIG